MLKLPYDFEENELTLTTSKWHFKKSYGPEIFTHHRYMYLMLVPRRVLSLIPPFSVCTPLSVCSRVTSGVGIPTDLENWRVLSFYRGVFGFGIVNYMKIIHFRVKSFLFSCMAVVGGTLGCFRRVQKANFNHSISQS